MRTNSGWARRVVAAAVVGGICGATLSPPATAAHGQERWQSARCAQAADGLGGGPFLTTTFAGATTGMRCRYQSTTSGGYLVAPAGAAHWYVTVERLDGTRMFYGSGIQSRPCADGVIAPGDIVELASIGAVAAGEGIGCPS